MLSGSVPGSSIIAGIMICRILMLKNKEKSLNKYFYENFIVNSQLSVPF